MAPLSAKKRDFFVKQGRLGGLKRSQSLSGDRRRLIAAKAARARWQSKAHQSGFSSIRLDDPNLTSPVFIEELLTEGSLTEWRRLYQKIADAPFGSEAEALEQVLNATPIYGVTPLWRGLLNAVRNTYS